MLFKCKNHSNFYNGGLTWVICRLTIRDDFLRDRKFGLSIQSSPESRPEDLAQTQ